MILIEIKQKRKKGRTTADTRGQDAHTGDNHKSPKKQIEQIFFQKFNFPL